MTVTGVGPVITVQDLGNPLAASLAESFANSGIDIHLPEFDVYGENLKRLEAVRILPDLSQVSPSNPEVIDFLFMVPGVEPYYCFPEWIRGVAIVASITNPLQREVLREAASAIGQAVTEGTPLPPIDVDFYDDVTEINAAIVGNGEPISWRPLVAFTHGAYWALSFVNSPHKRRGNQSPAEFLKEYMIRSALLAYAPR